MKFKPLSTLILLIISAFASVTLTAYRQTQPQNFQEVQPDEGPYRIFLAVQMKPVGSVPTPVPTPRPTTIPTQNPTVNPTPPPGSPMVVDRNSVALFERIPDQYLAAARALRMVYVDASVGQNINEGLECLTASSWAQAPAACRRDYTGAVGGVWKTFTQTDLQNGLVPARIQFNPDPVKYNRSNWTYVAMPSLWDSLISGFVQQIIPTYVNQKDVLAPKFNYLHVGPDSLIAHPVEGFFVDQPHFGFYPNRERWDISDIQALEAQYPNKVFFYMTASLSRNTGSNVSTSFNEQMRAYAAANNKYLFDIADILSHDDQGRPCFDNRDGVQYCGTNGCENFPDDGHNYPAICQDYTTETEGGHLGSVSAGKIRLAKAYWVLMARIAGWTGN